MTVEQGLQVFTAAQFLFPRAMRALRKTICRGSIVRCASTIQDDIDGRRRAKQVQLRAAKNRSQNSQSGEDDRHENRRSNQNRCSG